MRTLLACLGLSVLPITAHARGDTVPVRVLQADAEPSGYNLLVLAPAGPGGQWASCAAVTIQLHFKRSWSRNEAFERKYQSFLSFLRDAAASGEAIQFVLLGKLKNTPDRCAFDANDFDLISRDGEELVAVSFYL